MTKNITDESCGVPVRDRGKEHNRISIALGVISICIVALRLGFKLLTTHELMSDDYVVCFLILVITASVLVTHYGTTPNGVGRDIWTLTPTMITNFLYFFYVMAILYFAEVMLVKLCLLLFYLRIFPGKLVRRLLWATVVFDVLFGVIFLLVAIFQCSPISFFWQSWDGEQQGTCLNMNAIAWSNAGISIALDLWMLAIPLSQLRTLRLHWKKKIGVALMFCVGTVYVLSLPPLPTLLGPAPQLTRRLSPTSVTVVSIVRLQTLVTFATSDNPTWDFFPVSQWSTVEISVGIMCTCMPTLRLMLVRLFPILGGSSRSGKTYYYGNNDSGAGVHAPSSRGARGSGNRRSRTLGGRAESTGAASKGDGAHQHPGSYYNVGDADVNVGVVKKPQAVLRQQRFMAKYEYDDESSLVHLRSLDRNGQSRLSDDSV